MGIRRDMTMGNTQLEANQMKFTAEQKIKMLKSLKEKACHSMFCYSANYSMDEPRKGWEEEWSGAKQEVEMLEAIISDFNASL